VIPLFKHFVAPEAAGAIAGTLASNCIGQGPKVDELEAALERWIGKTVTVNSGTSALWLAYDLAGIKPDDYVIASPMTCLLANVPLAHMGARILWADVNPNTGLIDVDSVEKLLKLCPLVHTITCVDYAGTVCDQAALMSLCDKYACSLIIDAAHSFGANDGRIADFTAYSFQAIKHLTTGDGGSLSMLAEDARNEAILKRWCGLDRKGGGFRCDQLVTMAGYKFHMTDIAATLGLANLPYVADHLAAHRKHAAVYNDAGLGNMPMESSCWMYNVLCPDRDDFVAKMTAKGIQVARTHNRNDRHPIFLYWNPWARHGLPGVQEFNDRQCSIPVGWWLTGDQVQYIADSAREALGL
jgi:perosamine synthetase